MGEQLYCTKHLYYKDDRGRCSRCGRTGESPEYEPPITFDVTLGDDPPPEVSARIDELEARKARVRITVEVLDPTPTTEGER